MSNRREFIKDAAGLAASIAFTSCALLDAAHAQAPVKRRHVSVGGKRTKVIDVHAHCVIPAAMV